MSAIETWLVRPIARALTPLQRNDPAIFAAALALCAAPELSPRYGRLYAFLHDDVTRKLASPRLVAGEELVPPGHTRPGHGQLVQPQRAEGIVQSSTSGTFDLLGR